MKYIITYDSKIIQVTEEEYQKLCPVVENPENKFCQIKGQTYNINNFKYMGDKKNAPIVKGWNDVPAEQNRYEENGFGQFLLTGNASNIEKSCKKGKNGLIFGKYNSQEFRAFAKKIWDDHRKRVGADKTTQKEEYLAAVREQERKEKLS